MVRLELIWVMKILFGLNILKMIKNVLIKFICTFKLTRIHNYVLEQWLHAYYSEAGYVYKAVSVMPLLSLKPIYLNEAE